MKLLSASRLLSSRRARGSRVPVAIATLCTASLLLGAADASAAIRYAAPGGSAAAESACEQAHPCSLFNAASRFAPNTHLEEGDEVVVEPGNYSDTAGDLGPEGSIDAKEGTNVHGVVGQPRPVITLSEHNQGFAFIMGARDAVLSHVEIVSTDSMNGVRIDAGIVDGVVARGVLTPCFQEGGLIRNSACLSSGAGQGALAFLGFSGTNTLKLRNVTAIATGADSSGLRAEVVRNVELTVDAVGVLTRGSAGDVFAGAFSAVPHTPGTGAKIVINLDHSDFADIETKNDAGGGTATVTTPGSNPAHDTTAEPLLAADGYHELPNSPTIDAGAVDESSGATDIDGNQRVIGLADIGADEFQIPTATSVSCSPGSVVAAAGSTSCTVTVSSATGTPEGTVRLATDGPGAFAAPGSCSLAATGNGQAGCQLAYVPSAAGSGVHKLSAAYGGDAVHGASEDSTSVQVAAAQVVSARVPNTTLKKKPARKTAARQATFAFVSDQASSSFECKVDKRAFKSCRSPFKVKKLKRGPHVFQVRAVNGARVADATPAVFHWKVS